MFTKVFSVPLTFPSLRPRGDPRMWSGGANTSTRDRAWSLICEKRIEQKEGKYSNIAGRLSFGR